MSEPDDLIRKKGDEGLKRSVLESPDPHVRRYALYLLASERDPSHIATLTAALEDPDKGVREQAAVSLGETGPAAESTLIRLLNSHNWRVRYRAAEALGMIIPDKSIPELIGCLEDEKDHVRYMAAKSLGKRRDRHALTSLAARLNDENNYVRDAAARAIGQISGPETGP